LIFSFVTSYVFSLIFKDLFSTSKIIAPFAGSDALGTLAAIFLLPLSGTGEATSLSASGSTTVE